MDFLTFNHNNHILKYKLIGFEKNIEKINRIQCMILEKYKCILIYKLVKYSLRYLYFIYH